MAPMGTIVTDNQANDDSARYIALVTCMMSIPLLFPPARLDGFLLDWWLLSIYAVPVLIVLGLIIAVWTLVFSKRLKGRSLRWNLLGILVGLLAEAVEIILIKMPPKLP